MVNRPPENRDVGHSLIPSSTRILGDIMRPAGRKNMVAGGKAAGIAAGVDVGCGAAVDCGTAMCGEGAGDA